MDLNENMFLLIHKLYFFSEFLTSLVLIGVVANKWLRYNHLVNKLENSCTVVRGCLQRGGLSSLQFSLGVNELLRELNQKGV